MTNTPLHHPTPRRISFERASYASLEEVAAALGISPERCRQIQASALRKMKRGLERRGIDADLVHQALADLGTVERGNVW